MNVKVHHVPDPLQPFKIKWLLFICITHIYIQKVLQFTTLDKYHAPVQSDTVFRPATFGRHAAHVQSAGQGRAGHVNDTVVWQSLNSSADVIYCTVGGEQTENWLPLAFLLLSTFKKLD